MLSILCHFHGLLFARATLGSYSYIDQRNGPYSEGMFVVIVVDECFGDDALIEVRGCVLFRGVDESLSGL